MKYPILSAIVILLAAFAAPQNLSSEASTGLRSVPHAARPALSLETKTFEFPGAGERNNNKSIGDYCCTGETATVRTAQGVPVGYIYFHGFDGGITNGSRSAAMQFSVLVSGISFGSVPKSVRVKSAVEFASRELKPGLSRTSIAGALQYTVTILDVQFIDEAHSRYWMDSIKAKVDVREAPAASEPAAVK